jgi:hypothetical protein
MTTTDHYTGPSLRQRAEWEARKALVRRDPDKYQHAGYGDGPLNRQFKEDLATEATRLLADWALPEVTPVDVEPVPTTSGYQHPFPVARLYRGRTLHLNVPAVQLIRAEHGGTVPDHARVLIDRSQSLIVLELTREPGPSTARVGHRLSDNGQYVVGVRHAVHLLVGDPPTYRRHEAMPAAEVARIRAEWDTAAADRYLNEWEHDLTNYPGHGRYRLLRTPTGYAVRLTDQRLP